LMFLSQESFSFVLVQQSEPPRVKNLMTHKNGLPLAPKTSLAIASPE